MTSDTQAAGRTRTVTRPRIESVEYTKYVCPQCGQEYSDDNVVQIGVDKQSDRYRHRDILCTHCADVLFDYDTPGADDSYRLDSELGQTIERNFSLIVVAFWIVVWVSLGAVIGVVVF